MKPEGDGKGGTYFGATGCGKSYTMLFLARLLMKSVDLSSPTIVLITDRTDLFTEDTDPPLPEAIKHGLGARLLRRVFLATSKLFEGHLRFRENVEVNGRKNEVVPRRVRKNRV